MFTGQSHLERVVTAATNTCYKLISIKFRVKPYWCFIMSLLILILKLTHLGKEIQINQIKNSIEIVFIHVTAFKAEKSKQMLICDNNKNRSGYLNQLYGTKHFNESKGNRSSWGMV